MGFRQRWAPNRVLVLILVFFISQCHNSKISFPKEEPPVVINLDSDSDSNNSNSTSNSDAPITPAPTIVPDATPTSSRNSDHAKSSFIRFSDSDSNSADLNFFTDSPVYSLFPGENAILSDNSILNSNNFENGESESTLMRSPILTDSESTEPEVKNYVRSLEMPDSGEAYNSNPDRRLRYEDERRGWQYDDEERRPVPPDEKTIAFQVLDEDPYHHGRPAWPHDEYLLGYFDIKGALDRIRGVNSSSNSEDDNRVDRDPLENVLSPDELSKYYEWKRLQPRPRPSPSAFIGPGFYDVGSVGSSQSEDYYRYHQPTYQAITTDSKVQTTGSSSNGESSNDGEVSVPGSASESSTNTRGFPAYIPYDLYKRKRLRLQIHPGLIAAPLAGLAAFGAASAFTSKPLLLELGYVKNKPELIPGGWGWAGTGGTGYRPYPPFYPPPNPPPPVIPPFGVGTGHVGHHYPHGHIGGGYPHGPIGGGGVGFGGGGITHGSAISGAGGHGGGGGAPIYPILKPIRHKPESERTSWWNPFAALTPRLVIE